MSDYRWRIQNLARESIDEYITGAGLFGYVLIALWVPLLPVILVGAAVEWLLNAARPTREGGRP